MKRRRRRHREIIGKNGICEMVMNNWGLDIVIFSISVYLKDIEIGKGSFYTVLWCGKDETRTNPIDTEMEEQC